LWAGIYLAGQSVFLISFFGTLFATIFLYESELFMKKQLSLHI